MPIFGGIFIGRRHGAFDSTPSGGRVDDYVGPSIPPAGSYNSTLYGVIFPSDQGGSYVTIASTNYENQTCDVDVLNDGDGGTYTDWTSVSNVSYLPDGASINGGTPLSTEIRVTISEEAQDATIGHQSAIYVHDGSGGSYALPETVSNNYFANGTEIMAVAKPASEWPIDYAGPTFVESATGSTVYAMGLSSKVYASDGEGWYYEDGFSYPAFYPNGTYITGYNNQAEVPSGSGNYYNDGSGMSAWHDGQGGYYTDSTGYHPAGSAIYSENIPTEVPTGSGNYFNNGMTVNYTWDGSGGYNVGYTGSYHPANTVINFVVTTSTTPIEVPANSGIYYDSWVSVGALWKWDGSGGYTEVVSFYYPAGTFIYTDGTENYFHDGMGSYYGVFV